MNEQRQKILHMLAEGKITPEEADRLLNALTEPTSPPAPTSDEPVGPRPTPRYLRVVVEESGKKEGTTKVNIRVPLQLIRAGVKLATLLPESARDSVDQALSQKGAPFDLSRIKASEIEELIGYLADLHVDVDEKEGEGAVKVRVFAE